MMDSRETIFLEYRDKHTCDIVQGRYDQYVKTTTCQWKELGIPTQTS